MKYKPNRLIILAILILSIAVSFHFVTLHKKEIETANSNGFAVLELFTSEGCSSCPAADAVAAKLSEEYQGKVFVLGFHVDYWNGLGWKDQFSSAAYSNRQSQYAKQFHLNSVYTPQVIVNGKTEMVGSDESKLRSSISKELKTTGTAITLSVSAKSYSAKTINVAYKLDKTSNSLLNIALVQLHAQTDVKLGENKGRILKHVDVVRDYKTIAVDKIASGNIMLTFPQGLSSKDCKVITYLQNVDNLQITAATETIIE